MGQQLIRRVGVLMAGALALALVVGPATTALADGGPDRVVKEQSSGARPGFGDHIAPARPGFGDRVQPGVEAAPRHPAAAAAAATERHGGWSVTTMSVLAGILLAVGVTTLVMSAVRRRQRVAHA